MRNTDGTLTSGTEQEVVDLEPYAWFDDLHLRQIALAGPDVLYVAVTGDSGGIVRVTGLNTSGGLNTSVEALQVHLISHLPCAKLIASRRAG